MNLFFST